MNATLVEFNSYCDKRRIVESDMKEVDFLPIPVAVKPGPRPFTKEYDYKTSLVHLRERNYWQAMRNGKYLAGAKTRDILVEKLDRYYALTDKVVL